MQLISMVAAACILVMGPVGADPPTTGLKFESGVNGRPVLVSSSRRKALPVSSAALEDARQTLPDGFDQFETSRFVLLSDTSITRTGHQAELLERAYHQFCRVAREQGWAYEPLRHRLVAVLFNDRDEFLAYAREVDGLGIDGISGYYHPGRDRLVFYAMETDPQVIKARQVLQDLTSQAGELRDGIREALGRGDSEYCHRMRSQLDRVESILSDRRRKLEQWSSESEMATAIHEAIHQLCFHTRLQSPDVVYPLWLSEGLASSFETTEPDSAFGPDHRDHARIDRVRAWSRDDELVPMEELISIVSMHVLEGEQAEIFYDQSAVLFSWLVAEDPSSVRAFLRRLREDGVRMASPEYMVGVFTECFGEPGSIQRSWLRAIDSY